jgi:exopolysaccharide production protein ExoQ
LLQAERTSRRAGFLLVTLTAASALLAVGLWSIPYLAEFAGKDTTFSGRTDIWSATWWAIGQEPLKGYGLGGAFTGVELEPTRQMVEQIGFEAAHAHNGVLDIVLQLGWVGFLAFVVLVAPLCARGWFLVKAKDPLGLTVTVFLVSLVFVSISEPVFLLSAFSVIAMLHPPVLKRVPRTSAGRRAMLAAAR